MPTRRRTPLIALACLLLLGAFFLIAAAGWLKPVTDPLSRLTSAAAAPVYRLGAAFARARDAVALGTIPVDEAERLAIENAELRSLAAENAALKDALGYEERFSETSILARVISPTTDEAFHGLLIDRGTDDGVRPGQAVTTGSGLIVGKVLTARSRTAAVLLLSDSRSRLAVAVQNEAGTIGVLEGDRGLAMTVALVPLSEPLSPGETVITSGLEPGIRRGLVVGTIESVARGAQDPFQTAAVTPFKSAAYPVFVQVLAGPDADDPAAP